MRQLRQPNDSSSGGTSGAFWRRSRDTVGAADGTLPRGLYHADGSPLRALVIDDSDSARLAIASVLRAGGCLVWDLPSAIGASRVAMQNRIDVAVVDMSMPGLSGDKLVKVFRDNPRLEGVVIVVVSGCDAAELADVERTTAVDAVLAKRDLDAFLLPLLARLLAARQTPAARRTLR
jgi:CheY-like chemotaxis protein